MADNQPTQPELFDVAELPGRPMLHWHGKRPLCDILTDRKDVIFKRPPEAEISLDRWDGRLTLCIEQFYSPMLLQKLALEEDPEAIEDWRQTVVPVLIDPAYDGDVFHPPISDVPGRRDEVVAARYAWEAGEHGDRPVAVKIVGVLDETWFGVVGDRNH